jgi:hypothetical protein
MVFIAYIGQDIEGLLSARIGDGQAVSAWSSSPGMSRFDGMVGSTQSGHWPPAPTGFRTGPRGIPLSPDRPRTTITTAAKTTIATATCQWFRSATSHSDDACQDSQSERGSPA